MYPPIGYPVEPFQFEDRQQFGPGSPQQFPFPGFPPGQPPSPGPSFPGGQQPVGPPTQAPPDFVPQQPDVALFAVDPGGIRRCLFRFTFIWLDDGRRFWFYPIFVGRTSVAGYRWRRGRRQWVYFGISLDRIDSFQCS
ncbi:transporter [Bacillaceae bacterium Marseille-Q3522]|nr:transporter [Bacillaceae bacterium Marseille-Q3522]